MTLNCYSLHLYDLQTRTWQYAIIPAFELLTLSMMSEEYVHNLNMVYKQEG